MTNNSANITEGQQTRAYAGYYGLWVGLCWIASFSLSVVGLQSPLASNLGLLLGVLSLPLGVKLVRSFGLNVAPLTLGRAWRLSWLMYGAAALLCTAAQYIYFAYLDGGLLVRSYTDLLEQPEMQDVMTQILGPDSQTIAQEALNAFAATPPAQLALQFLLWNLLLATFLAFPTALFSFTRKKAES